MWKAYHQISETRYPQDISAHQFPISVSNGLQESLTSISKKYKFSIEGAIDYFSQPKNKNFHKDTLDPDQIDFKSYKMRLCNFLLEKIHSQGSYVESMHEFLYSNYREREEAMGKEVESDSESSLSEGKRKVDDDEEEDKTFLSGVASKVVDEIRKEKPEKEKKAKIVEEKKVPDKIIPVLKHKWSIKLLETHQNEIEESFKSFQKKGKIKTTELQDLCKSILSKFNLYLNTEDFLNFRKLLENYFCAPENYSKKSLKLEFSDLTKALTLWGEKYNESHNSFKGKLQKSLQKYSNLCLQFSEFSKISPILSKIKIKFQGFIDKYTGSPKKINFNQVVKKNLEEIFLFYAKSQKIQGAEDTFEGLESSNTSWNLGKFLRFCQNFDLTSEKNGIPKEQLSKIFKKTALNSRIMDMECFYKALEKIAEEYYNPQYDRDHDTNYCVKSVEDKKEMLFKLLKLEKLNSYLKKAKGFNVPHTPKDKIRIPKSHFKKLKLDYQLPESFIKQVESWKNRHQPALMQNPSFQLNKPGLKSTKKPRLRQSSVDLQSPRLGYAQKLKRNGHISQLEPIELMKKELISEEEEEEIEELEENIKNEKINLGESMRMVKISDLNNMDFEDFDESDFRDFITEEKDEYFDRIYRIEPKLQGILKMHQDKVAKGMKVIDKSKGIYSERKIHK